MAEHASRRLPPGPSKLSQKVIADDPEEEPPLLSKDHLTSPRPIALDSSGRNSPRTPSFDYKTRYDVADEGVNIPLLPLHAPQAVRLPPTRNFGTEQIVGLDVPHSTGIELRKDNKRLSDYRWTPSPDDTEIVRLDVPHSTESEPGKDNRRLSDYRWTPSPDDTEYDSERRRLYTSSTEVLCAIEVPSSSPNSSKYFDTTPPFTSTLGRFPKPPAQHPFAKNFEVPQWGELTIHTGLCALSYPILLIFVIMGQGKTLFWSRFFVGAGSDILGFMLGLSLVLLARRVLEAATWATIIHQSRIPDTHRAGVRLKDLAAHADTSSWAALRLLWDRHSYPGADREYRRSYDARKWSIWIIFFLLNVILSGAMSFLLGRAVDFHIQVVRQYQKYHEVIVSGDLSEDDLKQANNIEGAFDNPFLTWTLAPFSSHGELPAAISLNWKNGNETETVFFSEVIHSQLIPRGSGFGTFNLTARTPSLDSQDLMITAPEVEVETGSVVRFPRWGIRIKCKKNPDIPHNLVPLSKKKVTYLFTPRSTIRSLFDSFGLPFPPNFEQPFDFSTVVQSGDTLPKGLNKTGISIGAVFWDTGDALSLKSTPLSMGQDGKGFITVENILVRLNTSYAPNGAFGLEGSSIPDVNGTATFIGYDAAVCLELYEPWVLEVYNSSIGSPSSTRIVDKAAEIKDMNTKRLKEKRLGKPVSNPLVKRVLNSTNMTAAYIVGHQNSVNQILKDNDRDSRYVPSPMLVSFTSGDGAFGYTELSEVYYAKARALADAGNVLPYFAGSGLVVARRYDDQVITYPAINIVFMCMTILPAFLMGLISALFVPRLPLDVPRRGFDLYSWLSAFHAHELVAEHPTGISKDMDLRDIKDYTSELKFRHVV